jgi:asparagine synthase (glutamine-hydrolysing)
MLERQFFLADHNLIYTDKMGMAAGVETRVPLLDIDIVKFAAEVPTHWKQGLFNPKKILKQSQRGILPDHVIDRPKTGFGAPLRTWIKGQMQDLINDLLSRPTIEKRGLFNAGAAARLLDADRRGQIDASYTLFSLMCVELWCRRFVD